MVVIVDGVFREIEYFVASGCDMARDLIGSYESSLDDEDGRWIMTEEQYDWWTDEINKLVEIDQLIEDLEIKDELFDQYIRETSGCDLEGETDMQLAWLHKYQSNQ